MPQGKNAPGGGLSVATLVVSAVAAVIAAVVVSYVVPQGTLIATALTPVIVAISKELLDRPAKTIAAVPKVVTARGTAVQDVPRRPEAEPDLEREPPSREDPFGLYDRQPAHREWWRDRRVRLGLLTGLVAFVIGAAAITVSDLVTGSSVGGGGRTTLFSGDSKSSDDEKESSTPSATPTASPDAADPQATSTPPPAAAPSATATPEVTPSATPSATPPATPAPEGTPVP